MLAPVETPSANRIVTLDLLRGLFIAVILIDHLSRFPGFYELVTGEGRLWVSAAEGFFFISGVLVGIVRGNEVRSGHVAAVFMKLWKRAFLLGAWSIGLTLFYQVLAANIGEGPRIVHDFVVYHSIPSLLIDVVSFRYVYGWADFLPYYAAFLFWSPFALVSLKKAWWIVPLISISLWINRGTSFYDAWQPLFFSGVLIGYFRNELASYWQRMAPLLRRGVLIIVGIAAVATYLISSFQLKKHLPELSDYWALRLDRETMGWARLGMFAIWFGALYAFFSYFREAIERWFGGFLLPFGKHSLYVYILHSALLFAVGYAIKGRDFTAYENFMIVTAFVATLWLCVRRKFLFKIIPR
jgi:hypothetical protein